MKIFITTFYHDGQPFEGPKIYAENLEEHWRLPSQKMA
jgi:hypothetical protein